MRIYSFARDDGHHVDQHGSDFVLSPLTDPHGAARAACFHLGPGESVGEHAAVVGQLLCVVDGGGWVSGGDGARVDITALQAAYWTAGETHATGTDTGLTAIVLEGDHFDVHARPIDR